MAGAITIRDETVGGRISREWTLDILTERIDVRELIRSRVYQEVQDFNHRHTDVFQGLVQPAGADPVRDGYRLRKQRTLEWEPQFEKAIEAFELGRVLVLADGRQVERLDEIVQVEADTVVSFLRLVPLVGG